VPTYPWNFSRQTRKARIDNFRDLGAESIVYSVNREPPEWRIENLIDYGSSHDNQSPWSESANVVDNKPKLLPLRENAKGEKYYFRSILSKNISDQFFDCGFSCQFDVQINHYNRIFRWYLRADLEHHPRQIGGLSFCKPFPIPKPRPIVRKNIKNI
jgi:hypothetical protein